MSHTACSVCVCAWRRPHFPDDMVIKRLSPGALKSAFRQNVRKGLGGCKTNDALVCRSGLCRTRALKFVFVVDDVDDRRRINYKKTGDDGFFPLQESEREKIERERP